jgi:hypothetical protein
MQPNDGGVLFRRVISRRQINVEIARLSQSVRPDTAVFAVVVGIIHNFAGQSSVMTLEVKLPEFAAGLEGRGKEEKG